MKANFFSTFQTVVATVAVRYVLDAAVLYFSEYEKENHNMVYSTIASMTILLMAFYTLDRARFIRPDHSSP